LKRPIERELEDIQFKIAEAQEKLRLSTFSGDDVESLLWLFENFILHSRLAARTAIEERLKRNSGLVYVVGMNAKRGID
jgi:hypothetical protein